MGVTTKDEWLYHCMRLARKGESFYSGSRKIHRAMKLSFGPLDDSLQLEDAGYTKSKLTMLTKHYLHEESREVAVQLWDRRRQQKKYGSVSFSCFAHFIKGGSIDAKRSKRASVFGPCIQSVAVSWLSKDRVGIDVFYRTTELLKKFPADIVLLRDVLLEPFNFDGMEVDEVNFHFANITVHPMYFVTILPHLEDPIAKLDSLRLVDEHFWKWAVKWTARYLCPEYGRGIAKFAQSVRVQKDAHSRIPPKMLSRLQDYLRKNHPGYRNDYEEDDE